ncbi:MAG: SPW repeat protein [Verrucomicrobiae bacterium]|nr:SPW repeat protein [Verrucomicrobiae bacterium]
MWAQIINILLGLWLMIAPALLNYEDPAQTNDHIIGPLITTVSLVACWQIMRSLRWINLVFGVWLLLSPWLLHYPQVSAMIHSMMIGGLVIIFSFPKGKMKHQIGGGWASLIK